MSSSVKAIEVCRSTQGFGFILSNQAPCIVSSVTIGGPADVAGLKAGDEILWVNDENVSRASHEQVVRLILRSKGPVVNLKIRSYDYLNEKEKHNMQMLASGLELQDIKRPNISDIKSHDRLHNSIIQSVDKVVEDLQLGAIFRSEVVSKKPRIRESQQNDTDSELDSLSGSDDRRSPVDSISSDDDQIGKSLANYQIQREVKKPTEHDRKVSSQSLPGIISSNSGKALYPTLTPIKANEPNYDSVYKVVVGYLCSIELPSGSSLPTASLNAINNTVKRLHGTSRKIKNKSMVLMTLSIKGVTLSNSIGKEIVTYPLQSLAFSGACPDDKRFFGLVTRKTINNQNGAWAPKSGEVKRDRVSLPNLSNFNTLICSCHVFMVDPQLSAHSIHRATAEMFRITCTQSTEFGGCKEFPPTSTVILYALNALYRDRVTDESQSDSSYEGPRHKLDISESYRTPGSPGTPVIGNPMQKIRPNPASMPENLNSFQNGGLASMERLRIKEELDAQKQAKKDEVLSSKWSPSFLTKFMHKSKLERPPRFERNAFRNLSCENLSTRTTANTFDLERIGGSPLPSSSMNDTEKMFRIDKDISVVEIPADKEEDYVLFTTPTRMDCEDGPEPKDGNISLSIVDQDVENSKKPKEPTISSASTGQVSDKSEGSSMHPSVGNGSLHSSEQDISRVESWNGGLEKLLADAVALRCFQEFLRKEFSEENILFWIACQKLKSIKDQNKLKAMAFDIYSNHLASGAPYLVNVDQVAAKKAEEKLNNPDPNMFSLQQEQIFMLMKFDCYPRFLKSDLYRQCLQAEASEQLLPFQEEVEAEDAKKKKSTWYIKKSTKHAKDMHDPAEKKRSILSILNLGKGSKTDGMHKAKGRSNSLGSISDGTKGHSTPSTPDLDIRHASDSQKEVSSKSRSPRPSGQFCRVVLPSGSSTVIMAESGQTIRQALQRRVGDRYRLSIQAYDVVVGEKKEAIDLDKDLSILADNVIYLEFRILFRFDLPNRRSVGVKVHPSKTLYDVIEPIMRKNGFNIDDHVIHLRKCRVPLSLDLGVAAVENKHVLADTQMEFQRGRPSLGNITWKPPFGPKGSLRASLKRIGSTASKDDSILPTRYKTGVLKPSKSQESLISRRGSLDDEKSMTSRIGRDARSNARALRSKSMDLTEDPATGLVHVLNRSQHGRLEDQRGMIPKDIELPDFLKTPSQCSDQQEEKTGDYCPPNKRYSTPEPRQSVIISSNFPNLSPTELGQFRPASEVFFDGNLSPEKENYDDEAGRGSLLSVRSWSEIPSPERRQISEGKDFVSEYIASRAQGQFGKPPSLPTIKGSETPMKGNPLDGRKSWTVGDKVSDEVVLREKKNEIVRRESDLSTISTTSTETGRPPDTGSQMATMSDMDDEHLNSPLYQRKRLSKNLMTWRDRVDSCDSASSSAAEETDSQSSRSRIKSPRRDDSKRHSAPVVLTESPRSPLNKQKKLDRASFDAEVSMPISPVYSTESGPSRKTRPRPLPIIHADNGDLLKRLECNGSYEVIPMPEVDKTKDTIAGDATLIDGSAKHQWNKKKPPGFPAEVISQLKKLQKDKEQAVLAVLNDTTTSRPNQNEVATGLLSTDTIKHPSDTKRSQSLDESDLNKYNQTATGSVNDETVIMEDKDNGLDLATLMNYSPVRGRHRRSTRTRGEHDKIMKGETLPSKKTERITFV